MFWPTPLSSDMTSMSNFSSVSFGPTPETISSCGERNYFPNVSSVSDKP